MIDADKIDLQHDDYLFVSVFPDRAATWQSGAVVKREDPAFPVGRSHAVALGHEFSDVWGIGGNYEQVVEMVASTWAVVAVSTEPDLSDAELLVIPPMVPRRFGVGKGKTLAARLLGPMANPAAPTGAAQSAPTQ